MNTSKQNHVTGKYYLVLIKFVSMGVYNNNVFVQLIPMDFHWIYSQNKSLSSCLPVQNVIFYNVLYCSLQINRNYPDSPRRVEGHLCMQVFKDKVVA